MLSPPRAMLGETKLGEFSVAEFIIGEFMVGELRVEEFSVLLVRVWVEDVSTRVSDPPGFGIVILVLPDFIWLEVEVKVRLENEGLGLTAKEVDPPRLTVPPPIILLPALMVIELFTKEELGMLLKVLFPPERDLLVKVWLLSEPTKFCTPFIVPFTSKLVFTSR